MATSVCKEYQYFFGHGVLFGLAVGLLLVISTHFCNYWATALGIVLAGSGMGLLIPNYYIVTYAVTCNINPMTMFYVLAMLNAGGAVGHILPAILSGSFGKVNSLVPCVFLMGLSTLVFRSFANTFVYIMLYAVYGFFSVTLLMNIILWVKIVSESEMNLMIPDGLSE
ncbi:hypothetical protein BDW22DRAFT_1430982 [Trametopsis cervina]|nr:hypothetical protein BDW22DRAFT_1430982 [Trametopsis cervina]